MNVITSPRSNSIGVMPSSAPAVAQRLQALAGEACNAQGPAAVDDDIEQAGFDDLEECPPRLPGEELQRLRFGHRVSSHPSARYGATGQSERLAAAPGRCDPMRECDSSGSS